MSDVGGNVTMSWLLMKLDNSVVHCKSLHNKMREIDVTVLRTVATRLLKIKSEPLLEKAKEVKTKNHKNLTFIFFVFCKILQIESCARLVFWRKDRRKKNFFSAQN